MFKGLLLKESLDDLGVLDALHITRTETWQVDHPGPGQPSVWTAISFVEPTGRADPIADALSRALKVKSWYINASTGAFAYVIFPCKVFKYRRGDAAQRASAREYGRLIDIPENQLDWKD